MAFKLIFNIEKINESSSSNDDDEIHLERTNSDKNNNNQALKDYDVYIYF